jgi:hypothetical protein
MSDAFGIHSGGLCCGIASALSRIERASYHSDHANFILAQLEVTPSPAFALPLSQ